MRKGKNRACSTLEAGKNKPFLSRKRESVLKCDTPAPTNIFTPTNVFSHVNIFSSYQYFHPTTNIPNYMY